METSFSTCDVTYIVQGEVACGKSSMLGFAMPIGEVAMKTASAVSLTKVNVVV